MCLKDLQPNFAQSLNVKTVKIKLNIKYHDNGFPGLKALIVASYVSEQLGEVWPYLGIPPSLSLTCNANVGWAVRMIFLYFDLFFTCTPLVLPPPWLTIATNVVEKLNSWDKWTNKRSCNFLDKCKMYHNILLKPNVVLHKYQGCLGIVLSRCKGSRLCGADLFNNHIIKIKFRENEIQSSFPLKLEIASYNHTPCQNTLMM